MNVRISVDSASLEAARERLSPKRIDSATRSAINRAMGNLNTELSKRLGQHLALKASTIKAHIRRQRARGQALEASLSVDFRPISLREYPHTMTRRRGLSVRILRGEGRKRISGGFVGTTIGGSLYQRVPGAPKRRVEQAKGSGKNNGKMKQPISKMHGPSVRAVAAPILKELVDSGWVAERLAFHLDGRLRAALDSRAARAAPTEGEA